MRFRIILGGLIFTTPGDYSHSIEVKLPNSEEFKKAIEIPFSIKEIQNLPIKIIQQEK